MKVSIGVTDRFPWVPTIRIRPRPPTLPSIVLIPSTGEQVNANSNAGMVAWFKAQGMPNSEIKRRFGVTS
jgi:hypothetical protein